jgi:hypothetical protein
MKQSAGAFNVNFGCRIDAMKDGTSNSVLMAESAGGPEMYVGLPRVGANTAVNGAQRMAAMSMNAACDNPWSQGYIGGVGNGPADPQIPSKGGFGSVFGASAWNAWYDKNRSLAPASEWFAYPINEAKLRFTRPTYAGSSRPNTNSMGQDGSALPGTVGSVQGFRSYHGRVAHFLLGDGSAKTISEDIDPAVLVAYTTIAGREPIEDQ